MYAAVSSIQIRRVAPRFVRQFPGEDRRVLAVLPPGVGVGPVDQHGDVRPEPVLAFRAGVEARRVAHEGSVVPRVGDGRALVPGDVLRHPARPLPEVVQHHHGSHAALAHLRQQEVQPVEDAASYSPGEHQCRHRPVRLRVRTLGGGHDPEVGDAERPQSVELLAASRGRSPLCPSTPRFIPCQKFAPTK